MQKNPVEELRLRRPAPQDAQAVVDLMAAFDLADGGEADTSLEDLQEQWEDLDLEADAWLAEGPGGQIAGYAAVSEGDQNTWWLDYYTHPTLAPAGLTRRLLALCEERARQQAAGKQEPCRAAVIISHSRQDDQQAARDLGFQVERHHFGMRITLDAAPQPAWPAGVSLRTVDPEADGQRVYDFIQAAFERPGRTPPSFERWSSSMLGASNFDSSLWFLVHHGDELVAACLCFDYPQYGWVRQLGVAPAWRRRGLGAALLQHAFAEFLRRGHSVVGLGVESENANAFHLYESVGMARKHQYAEFRKVLSV